MFQRRKDKGSYVNIKFGCANIPIWITNTSVYLGKQGIKDHASKSHKIDKCMMMMMHDDDDDKKKTNTNKGNTKTPEWPTLSSSTHHMAVSKTKT